MVSARRGRRRQSLEWVWDPQSGWGLAQALPALSPTPGAGCHSCGAGRSRLCPPGRLANLGTCSGLAAAKSAFSPNTDTESCAAHPSSVKGPRPGFPAGVGLSAGQVLTSSALASICLDGPECETLELNPLWPLSGGVKN